MNFGENTHPLMVAGMDAVLHTAAADSATRMRVAWLCATVLLLEGYDIVAIGCAVPALVDAWRLPPRAFTTALAAGNLGILLGSLTAGMLGDRRGRKPVLIACVIIFGAGSLATALAAWPTQLAALRLFTGIGLGGGIPTAIALAADFAPLSAPGRLVISIIAAVPIGLALGGVSAGVVMSSFGWRVIFLIGGAAPLILSPLLVVHLPESPSFRAPAPRRSRIALLFQGDWRTTSPLVWVINFLSLLTTYLILLWTPAVLHGAGASPFQATLAASVYSFGLIAGTFCLAAVVDRFGIERVLTASLALATLTLLAIGQLDPRNWQLIALLLGAGLGGSSQGGINALCGLIYPPALRASGAGWAIGFGRLGAIGGPLLGGLVLGRGFGGSQIFTVAAISACGAAVLMGILAYRRGTGGIVAGLSP
jgi:AAHS family 4-hydroxybenzoate transporter-like MFS transporter